MRFYTDLQNCFWSAVRGIGQAAFWKPMELEMIFRFEKMKSPLFRRLASLSRDSRIGTLGNRPNKKFASAVHHKRSRFSPKTHLEFTWTTIFERTMNLNRAIRTSLNFELRRETIWGRWLKLTSETVFQGVKCHKSKLSLTFKTIKFCISMFIQSHERFRHYIRDLVYSVSSQNIAEPQSCN